MREPGIRGYIKELVRMLQKDGHLYFTFFLYDAEARQRSEYGESTWNFPYQEQGVFLHREDQPEWAVAISESLFVSLTADYGLTVHKIIRGPWRNGVKGGQDIAFFTK